MPLYETDTLYQAYCELNDDMLRKCAPDGKQGEFKHHYGMRGVPRLMTTGVQINAHGFGLDPKFPFHESRRVALLEKRYLDQGLWDENVARLQWATRNGSSIFTFPARSYNFLLHRDSSLKRNPRGGGCLLGMSLTFDRGVLSLDILSRASESVCALYGDFLFVEYLLDKALKEGGVTKFPRAGYQMNIRWMISIAYQNSVYGPPFLLWNWGPEKFQRWLDGKEHFPNKKEESFWSKRLRQYVNEVSLGTKYGEGNRGRWSRWLKMSLGVPYVAKLKKWPQLKTESALDFDDKE